MLDGQNLRAVIINEYKIGAQWGSEYQASNYWIHLLLDFYYSDF